MNEQCGIISRMDDEIPITVARCCSVCGEAGHKAPTCPQRVKDVRIIERKQVLTMKDLETVRDLAVMMTGGYLPEDRVDMLRAINRFCKHFNLEPAV